MNEDGGSSRVETLVLREGMTLVLSDIELSEQCTYHFVEPDDVFGIGFHLKGGSRFEMEDAGFDTKPLEVHAGATPRMSASTFTLPSQGFRTASLRFSLGAARDLIERHGLAETPLASMVEQADCRVSVRRLSSLNAAGAASVEAMFTAPYSGAGRLLYLESCALSLLAGQIDTLALAGEAKQALASDRGLTEARAYLDAHLDDPPGIVQLARICGINDFKLKRAFKEAFGTTIFGYVRQRRMERAIGDLQAGMAVAQTAAEAGYECPRCFADAFRRHFGLLPSEVSGRMRTKTPARNGQ